MTTLLLVDLKVGILILKVELSQLSYRIGFIEVIGMGISKDILTEEKVRKLKPIFERALARKYGKEFKLKNLTLGHITVDFKKDA